MEETKAEQEELILIRITGQDRPGLTTAVMAILAHYNAHVLFLKMFLNFLSILRNGLFCPLFKGLFSLYFSRLIQPSSLLSQL